VTFSTAVSLGNGLDGRPAGSVTDRSVENMGLSAVAPSDAGGHTACCGHGHHGLRCTWPEDCPEMPRGETLAAAIPDGCLRHCIRCQDFWMGGEGGRVCAAGLEDYIRAPVLSLRGERTLLQSRGLGPGHELKAGSGWEMS